MNAFNHWFNYWFNYVVRNGVAVAGSSTALPHWGIITKNYIFLARYNYLFLNVYGDGIVNTELCRKEILFRRKESTGYYKFSNKDTKIGFDENLLRELYNHRSKI